MPDCTSFEGDLHIGPRTRPGPVVNFELASLVDGVYRLEGTAVRRHVFVDANGFGWGTDGQRSLPPMHDGAEPAIGEHCTWLLSWSGGGGDLGPSLELHRRLVADARSAAPIGAIGTLLITVSGKASATLVDRQGRRTGWNRGHPTWQTRDCRYSSGDEGEDDEHDEESGEANSVMSSWLPDSLSGLPDIHEFDLGPGSDSSSMLRDGGCDLLIEGPISPELMVHMRAEQRGGSLWTVSRTDTLELGRTVVYRLSWREKGGRIERRSHR